MGILEMTAGHTNQLHLEAITSQDTKTSNTRARGKPTTLIRMVKR